MAAMASQSCFNCSVLILANVKRYRIADMADDLTMWDELKLKLGVNDHSCLCQKCFDEYQSTSVTIQEPEVEVPNVMIHDSDPLMGSAGFGENATVTFEEPRSEQNYNYRIKLVAPETAVKTKSSSKKKNDEDDDDDDVNSDDDNDIDEPAVRELSSDEENVEENVNTPNAPPILDGSKLKSGTKCDWCNTGLKKKEYRNLPEGPEKDYIVTKTFAREPATKRLHEPDQPQSQKRLCSHQDKQHENMTDHSEDEDEDDEEDDNDGMNNDATPSNLRLTTRKIRELEIFQIEGQDEAAANVLEQANELMQEERLSSTRQLLELPDVQMGPPSRPASPPSSQPTDDSVTFTWSSDFSTFQGKPEKYLRSSKAHTNARTPLGVFMEVWDLQIMKLIADETNRYAWQTIAAMTEREETISDSLGAWKETNAEEMYRFFAVLNYMTLCYRSRLEEYWTTGILGMSEFRHIMGRNRFLLILRFLHFVNNDTLTPMGQSRYQNRIAKVGPIIDHCNRKFAELYTPNRELSLDESLLLWKGRLSWAQCIRAKAARFGIKTYELCEAESGYLLRMLLYAGKGSSMFEGPIHGFENTTAKTVVELMDGYLDVGHMLVMDNWYNQLVLTRFLKSRRTDVVGTMARQRKYVPDKIKSAVDRFMERGDQIALHCGDISIVTWKDVKLVTLISTYHKADVDTPRDDQERQERTKPPVVNTYNKYMGGVDLKDQKLSNYFFERTRGRKWYLKVFRRLLNISILNTYTVAGKIDGFNNDEKLTMRRYRYALSEEILKAFPRVQVARPPIAPTNTSCATPKEPRPVPSGKVPVRLEDTNTHFAVHTAKVKGKLTRRRCACCSARGKQKRITTMCKKCDVGLCLGDCWIDYHTLLRLEP